MYICSDQLDVYPFSKVFFNNDILTLSPILNFDFLFVISKL